MTPYVFFDDARAEWRYRGQAREHTVTPGGCWRFRTAAEVALAAAIALSVLCFVSRATAYAPSADAARSSRHAAVVTVVASDGGAIRTAPLATRAPDVKAWGWS